MVGLYIMVKYEASGGWSIYDSLLRRHLMDGLYMIVYYGGI